MNDTVITHFLDNINSLNAENVNEILHKTYSQHINFIDPVKNISGLENLNDYFTDLYKKVDYCHFELTNCLSNGNQYSLEWVMNLRYKKLSKDKTISLNGASFVQFKDGKIDYHRDYYDLGALVYEQLPFLGTVVKKVRSAI